MTTCAASDYSNTRNYTGPSQIIVISGILTLLRRCSDNLRMYNKDEDDDDDDGGGGRISRSSD
jgi:hypothetical protein